MVNYVNVMYFISLLRAGLVFASFRSLLVTIILALDFLNVLAICILVFYKWVSYKKSECTQLTHLSANQGLKISSYGIHIYLLSS